MIIPKKHMIDKNIPKKLNHLRGSEEKEMTLFIA